MNIEQRNPEADLDTHNEMMVEWDRQQQLSALVAEQRMDLEGRSILDKDDNRIEINMSSLNREERAQVAL